MSWGIEHTGTKDAVIAAVTTDLDRTAKSYEGKEEAKDVLSAKERIVSLINALDLSKDTYTDWNGVTVKANGSHSTSGAGVSSASFNVSVVRTSLKLG